MGNEQTSSRTTDIQIELNHSKIRFIKVVNDPKQRHMQAKFAGDKDEYNKWVKSLKQKKLNSEYLLLPISHEFESSEFCGSAGAVKVNYENYPYLLQEEIENRRHKKKRFDETELWLLLFCLLQAQKQVRLNDNNSPLGDVRPQNVFLNEQGLMKVGCGLSWPKETSGYQKFLQNQVTYLAPEDMLLLQQNKVDNAENSKSQIFSIGLTILSAANLTSYNQLYSASTRRFNGEGFLQVLNEWRMNEFYSDIFKATLTSMLEVDLERRVQEKILSEWIQQYRESILARKDFVISDPPQAVINEVQVIKGLYDTLAMGGKFGSPGFEPNRMVVGGLEGSRRVVVESRPFVPMPIIPQQSHNPIVTQTAYSSQKPSYLSNILLQGAPIGNVTSPMFINRTSVPTLYSETKQLEESVNVRNWSSVQQQPSGLGSINKMNYEYGQAQKSMGQECSGQSSKQIQGQQQPGENNNATSSPQKQQQQTSQPQITQSPTGHEQQ